VSESTQHQKVH